MDNRFFSFFPLILILGTWTAAIVFEPVHETIFNSTEFDVYRDVLPMVGGYQFLLISASNDIRAWSYWKGSAPVWVTLETRAATDTGPPTFYLLDPTTLELSSLGEEWQIEESPGRGYVWDFKASKDGEQLIGSYWSLDIGIKRDVFYFPEERASLMVATRAGDDGEARLEEISRVLLEDFKGNSTVLLYG